MEKLLLKRPALCRSFLLLLNSHCWKVMLVISMMVTSCTKEDAILSVQHQSKHEINTEDTSSEQAVNAAASTAFPLKFSSNGRYLVDQNNVPFLFNGDTGWFIFDKISTQDYDVYLDNMAAKGFTVVNIMAPWNFNVKNFYGAAPFGVQGILSSPSQAWWARVDTFVSKAAARGLLVNMVPLWLGWKGAQWYIPLPNNSLPVCRTFGRWLGDRYKNSPNVMFTIGGDVDPGDRYSRLNEIALGIVDSAPDKIISGHTAPNKVATTIYGNASWLNLNAVYTYFPGYGGGNGTHVYSYSRNAYNRTPMKPFILIESGYERGSRMSPAFVRRQAYWAILSGATGANYGNSSIWPFKSNWKTAMNDAGAQDLKHFYDVFNARAWYNLVPDFNHTVVTAGYGTFNAGNNTGGGDDYVTSGRSADGKLIMAYLPPTGTDTRTLTVDMTKLTSNSVVAKWYNPTNGNNKTIGNFSNTNAAQTFTTPGNNGESNNDWLLILETGTGGEDDITPNPFSFTGQSNVELNTLVTSNAVKITGINAASPIAITGGEYQVNSGAFTSTAGTVAAGNTVRVRLTSASTNSTTKSAVLNIGGVTGSFNVTTKSTGGTLTNLALNKPVTYSGQQVGNEAFKAVDGLTNTRWSWAPWPQWLQVDLGSVHSISQTELLPYLNRAYQYKVEVSTDGSTYTTVVDMTGNTTGGATLLATFSPADGRYVRLTVTGCSGYTGGYVSFYEFRVLGN